MLSNLSLNIIDPVWSNQQQFSQALHQTSIIAYTNNNTVDALSVAPSVDSSIELVTPHAILRYER